MMRFIGMALGAAVLVCATARPAGADPGTVIWPTFLRTGPGPRFVVLDELLRGTALDVRSCADQWCQVRIGRAVGYVDQADLGSPRQTVSPAPASPEAGCFDSRRAGYRKGEVFRYCPRAPSAGSP